MTSRFMLSLAALTALLLPPAAEAAYSNGISAQVVVCGSTATEYGRRGTTYVEARDGCEYAIHLTNNTSDRVAIHLSVDGLNTIDASQSSPSNGPRWVLEPWQSAVIPGWQTGSSSSRKFYFTTADGSYAEWIGDTSDAGQIRIVAYRERQSLPIYIEPSWDGTWRRGDSSSSSGSSRGWDADGEASAEKRSRSEAAPSASDSLGGSWQTWRDERAATGIGRETGHSVRTTSFDAESTSFARITFRYGYHDQLVSWNVLPQTPCRCCDGYAPDPYDYYDHRCR